MLSEVIEQQKEKLDRITWEEVREMRFSWRCGTAIREIAEKYGLTFNDTKNIVIGKTWRDKKSLENESDEYATIEQAYDDLSRHSFATWVRMNVMPQSILNSGRLRVAQELGISWQRLAQMIPELRNKGYIKISQGETDSRIGEISIIRPLMVAGSSHIVKLGISKPSTEIKKSKKNKKSGSK